MTQEELKERARMIATICNGNVVLRDDRIERDIIKLVNEATTEAFVAGARVKSMKKAKIAFCKVVCPHLDKEDYYCWLCNEACCGDFNDFVKAMEE